MANGEENMTGHNSGELTPAEHRALFMYHFNPILAQTEVCRRENEERKRLRKIARAAGIPSADLDYALRVATIEDTQIIKDEHIRHAQIAAFFALPIGTQVDMEFDAAEPIEDRAEREGAAAGYREQERIAPYGDTSKAAKKWLKAYDAALAAFKADAASADAKIKQRQASATADDTGANDPEESEPGGEGSTTLQ